MFHIRNIYNLFFTGCLIQNNVTNIAGCHVCFNVIFHVKMNMTLFTFKRT